MYFNCPAQPPEVLCADFPLIFITPLLAELYVDFVCHKQVFIFSKEIRMEKCDHVTNTFLDPATHTIWSCASICYMDKPQISPDDCRLLCPGEY